MFSNYTDAITGYDYYNLEPTMNNAFAADPDVVLNANLPSLADFESAMEIESPSIASTDEGGFTADVLEFMHGLPPQVPSDQDVTQSTDEPYPTVDMADEAPTPEVASSQMMTVDLDHDHDDDASDDESGGSDDDSSAASEREDGNDSESESSESSESESREGESSESSKSESSESSESEENDDSESEIGDEESRAEADSMPGPSQAVGAAQTLRISTLSSVPTGPPPPHGFTSNARRQLHADLWHKPEDQLLAFKPYLDGAARPANSRPLPDQTRIYRLTCLDDWKKEMEDIRGQQNAVALLEALRDEIGTEATELRGRFPATARGDTIRENIDKMEVIVLNRLRVELAKAKGETPPSIPAEPGQRARQAILRSIRETERVWCIWCGKNLCNRKNNNFARHVPQCPPWLALDDRLLVAKWRELHQDEVHKEHREQLAFECTQGRVPATAASAPSAAAPMQQNAATPAPVRAQRPRATGAAAPRTTAVPQAASGATRTRTRAPVAPSMGAPQQRSSLPPRTLRSTARGGQAGTAQQSAAGPTRTLRSKTRGARPYP